MLIPVLRSLLCESSDSPMSPVHFIAVALLILLIINVMPLASTSGHSVNSKTFGGGVEMYLDMATSLPEV